METTWRERRRGALKPGDPIAALAPERMTHELTCRVNGGAKLVHERLVKSGDEVLFEANELGEEQGIKVVTPGHPNEGMTREKSALQRWGYAWLQDELSNTLFLDLKPSAMREWSNPNAPFGAEGENFAGRLAAHFSKDPTAQRTVVDWLRELCAPEIDNLDFDRSKVGDVLLRLFEKGGREVTARSISDGTLRFLGLFVALNVEAYPVVVIEEIDTGLHPTRLRALVELIQQVPRERPVQIIATTHSPTLLQWLSAESLRDVVVFGRLPDREGTIMRRLGDIDHVEEALKHDSIDELFSTGWMEMAL